MSEYDPIPLTVTDALRQWDADEAVFTVEMGGIGPGYEQCIHILAFELMRSWKDVTWPVLGEEVSEEFSDARKAEADAIVKRLNPTLRFSGAQVGAAQNLAARVCRVGYRAALREEAVKDRLIQVSRKMPEVPQ